MFGNLVVMGLASLIAAQDPEPIGEDEELPEGPLILEDPGIEEDVLPTIEEMEFPVLTGDFDGDGDEDSAQARQSESGVQIALELSTTGDTYVEALGADTLQNVEWEVIEADAAESACDDPIDCLSADGLTEERDVILVTLYSDDTFILRWDGEALETLFVDA